jgi:hypothetical protein
MRWHVLRTLLHKEALRHLANRGGLALVVLLVVAALLLSVFGGPGGAAGGLAPGVRACFVDYWEEGPLVGHLRANVPAELKGGVRFRPASEVPADGAGRLVYPPDAGAIQLRPAGGGVKVWVWYPGSDPSGMAAYEAWFWREALRFGQAHPRGASALGRVEAERSSLGGGLDGRSGLATSLVLFGVFFVCVYLMPSLTCEERERGVLLAQALSPASAGEILAAKFLFYALAGVGLAAVLAGTYEPRALARPFFWLSLAVAVAGAMGVGLVIAGVARTQRSASLGAMGYLLGVALVLFICRRNGIPGLPYLALEHHCPRVLHAGLTGSVRWDHWLHLAGAAGLAVAWSVAAGVVFRRFGWQ